MFFKISKFFLYLTPFTVLVVSSGTLFPFIVGKYVFFRIITGLALICFLWGWATDKSKSKNQKSKIWDEKNKFSNFGSWFSGTILKSPLVIAVSVFVLIFILACFFGYDPASSFWSNFERGEGGLQMLFLGIFFILLVLLFRDEKSWRKMFLLSVVAAGLSIVFVLIPGWSGLFFGKINLCGRFPGSLGNSAYMGTYLIFVLFYAAFSANGAGKKYQKWILFGSLVFFFIFLFLTQTRGAFLGLAAGILAGLAYLIFYLPAGRLRLILTSLLFFLIVAGFFVWQFRQSINLMPFCKGGSGNRLLDLSFQTRNFQTRLLLWKQSLKIFRERPLLGWGPENFYPAIEKYGHPAFEVWFDRAHNIFIDYLTQTGILGLLSYLSVFAAFFWQLLKKSFFKPQNFSAANCQSLIANGLIFALAAAYLIQGLVLFEVLPIYINLFLFLGFVNYWFDIKNQ